MKATLFEFRNRWYIIFGLFSAAFLTYFIDQRNSGVAVVNWLARRLGTSPTENAYRLIFALGALLLAGAAFLRTWGTSYLHAEVMRDARVRTERLLADGPYRYVRNPLYLGNILLSLSVGLMASRIGYLLLSTGMTVFVIRLLMREEAELLRDLGEPYRRYCAAVPRLIPSLAARVPSAGHRPDWEQSIRAESMYWLMTVSMVAFAITLNIKLFWGVLAAAVLASVLLHRIRKTTVDSAPADR